MAKYTLNRDREYELVVRYQSGDKKAGEDLLRSNFGLIHTIIKDVLGSNDHDNDLRDDLFQEGCIGFMAGVQNFDTTRGVNLGTYAVWHIKRCVYSYYTFRTRNIKYINSADCHRLSQTFSRACQYVQARHAGQLSWPQLVEEVKKFLGANDDQINRVLLQMTGEKSIHQVLGSEDSEHTVEQALGRIMHSTPDPASEIEHRMDTNRLYEVVEQYIQENVKERDIDIIHSRYMKDVDEKFKDIAVRHGLTRQAIQLRLRNCLDAVKYGVQEQIGKVEIV